MEKVHYVGTTSQTYADDKLFTYVLHNKEYVLHTLLSVTREIHYHLKISLDVSILIFFSAQRTFILHDSPDFYGYL